MQVPTRRSGGHPGRDEDGGGRVGGQQPLQQQQQRDYLQVTAEEWINLLMQSDRIIYVLSTDVTCNNLAAYKYMGRFRIKVVSNNSISKMRKFKGKIHGGEGRHWQF